MSVLNGPTLKGEGPHRRGPCPEEFTLFGLELPFRGTWLPTSETKERPVCSTGDPQGSSSRAVEAIKCVNHAIYVLQGCKSNGLAKQLEIRSLNTKAKAHSSLK